MSKVLIIEDDLSIRQFVVTLLKTQAYEVVETGNGTEGFNLSLNHSPDVILLDLGLPDIDGLAWIKEYRDLIRARIIVLTARDANDIKINALDAGADDYLTKPFNPGELLARIRVAVRHKINEESQESMHDECIYDDLRIDVSQRRVFIRNAEVHLTPTEYQILLYLIRNKGKVCTSRMLIKTVWGDVYSESDFQNLRVNMANLRRKIEPSTTQPKYIITHVGVGYRFND